MCGIIGYAGHRPAVPCIIEGLHRLEYRGYDSAGVGFIQDKVINIIKAPGKLNNLEKKLEKTSHTIATTGVGHTRWATHGEPTEANAHPHSSNDQTICLVHNGIIENYQEIKSELSKSGMHFLSETDTEVLVNSIQQEIKKNKTTLEAFAKALRNAQGAYAVAMLSKDEPGTIYAARHSAPLLLGIGTGENFVASDLPAFLNYTRDVIFLEDGEIVKITATSWEVFDLTDLSPIKKDIQHIEWDLQSAQKDGYRHFMLKEILEQPRVIADCMAGRISSQDNSVSIPELDSLPVPSRLRIVACGTSYNAGLWAQSMIEQWAGIPTTIEIASEFRYRDPLLSEGELVLAISQSGETADTLAALKIAKGKGCVTLGLCNVVGSSISREADRVLFTQAGPEISVASTKAMCSQMVIFCLLALYWGKRTGKLSQEIQNTAVLELSNLPAFLDDLLPSLQTKAKSLAWKFASCKGMFFLGRGPSFPLALEGALKVKELSYIHAEGYAAGEMKHGPIALVEPDFLSFFVLPHDSHYLKTKSNLQEVQARRGSVIILTNPSTDNNHLTEEYEWIIPNVWSPLTGIVFLTALQLFSYESALYMGNDVDQPRNLAKSVTVE